MSSTGIAKGKGSCPFSGSDAAAVRSALLEVSPASRITLPTANNQVFQWGATVSAYTCGFDYRAMGSMRFIRSGCREVVVCKASTMREVAEAAAAAEEKPPLAFSDKEGQHFHDVLEKFILTDMKESQLKLMVDRNLEYHRTSISSGSVLFIPTASLTVERTLGVEANHGWRTPVMESKAAGSALKKVMDIYAQYMPASQLVQQMKSVVDTAAESTCQQPKVAVDGDAAAEDDDPDSDA